MAKLGELGPDTLRRSLCFCPRQRCVLQCDRGPGVAGRFAVVSSRYLQREFGKKFLCCASLLAMLNG